VAVVLRIARLVAGRDLRIEGRSRTMLTQVFPFAAIVLVLFAFALDNKGVVQRGGQRANITEWVAPGLLWLATVFSLMLLVQRSFAVETSDGALDALRVAGVEPGGIFLGKAAALAVQLIALQLALLAGIVVLFDSRVPGRGIVLLVTTLVLATCGLAAVGTLYGGLTAGAKGRETLLPLLLLPVVAPVLIGAARATEAAFGIGGVTIGEGWPWVAILAVFAASFTAAGTVAFGPLIDD
jgi:heme exporter protein B